MADTLGLGNIAAADLHRPVSNLALGAGYLAQQSHAHGGDLSQTLAGYNAGGDPDRFYEAVDFTETRLYIRLVTANYAVYNALYRGAGHLTSLRLPLTATAVCPPSGTVAPCTAMTIIGYAYYKAPYIWLSFLRRPNGLL